MSRRTGYFVAILACALMAACQSASPVKTFVKGDEINYYDFTASDQFEQGTYNDASLLVRDGVYRIDVRSGDDELWWGQGGPTLGDVVIDVDATQLSERNENAFGVMCRVRGHVSQQVTVAGATAEATAEATVALNATSAATAEATASATSVTTPAAVAESTTDASIAAQGLAQMMAGATTEATAEATGAATQAAAGTAEATSSAVNPLAQELAEIPAEATAESTAESTLPAATVLEDDNGDGYLFLIQGTGSFAIFRSRGRSLTPLVNWTTSDKIKVGPDANHLRAVCVGTYLAFYANDSLLGEATDDAYQEGQVGLTASAANRLGVRIEFDNLSIASAKPG